MNAGFACKMGKVINSISNLVKSGSKKSDSHQAIFPVHQQTLHLTRLSLKCSAWKGFINFALRKFRSKKVLCQKFFFKKRFGSEKCWSEKKVLSEKFWSEKILVRNSFGTNKMFGLNRMGPKKILDMEKNWGSKQNLKLSLRPK